jgi:hypothetical protein
MERYWCDVHYKLERVLEKTAIGFETKQHHCERIVGVGASSVYSLWFIMRGVLWTDVLDVIVWMAFSLLGG